MKLNLLFIIMDLFTILAYPFVFMHSKLFQFSKTRAGIPLANALAIVSVLPGK
jgi:hypothetical protein